MNEQNYASLEASKRLAEAGIRLETEAVWEELLTGEKPYMLAVREYGLEGDIPAPCMAEAWRELPEEFCHSGRQCSLQIDKIRRHDGTVVTSAQYQYSDKAYPFGELVEHFNANLNPTDALVDLLSWVRKEMRSE